MSARSLLTSLSVFTLVACGTAEPQPTSRSSRSAAPGAPLVSIARDAAGAPRMLAALGPDLAPAAGSPVDRARAHLAGHAAQLGASRADIAALEVARVTGTRRGGSVTTFRARVAGLEVVGGDVRVLTRGDGSLALVSGLPPPPARERPRFVLSSAQAFALALAAELGRAVQPTDLVAGPDVAGGHGTFRAPGVALIDPSRVKRVLAPDGGALRPAYRVEILRQDAAGRPRGAEYLIDSASGAVLRTRRLESDAAFQYRVWASSADKRPHDGPLADVTPHPTGEPDGLEPAATAPSLISMEAFNQPSDPWLAAGATTTRGNNVDAYADVSPPDGFDDGDLRATTTGTRAFDRTYNLANAPGSTAQRMASVVHLFYVNNWMHDWWYDSGFDEAAGNAQASNFGRGGIEGDVLLAEAQDFSGTENANMMTPADGVSPRMQMFLFRGSPNRDAALDSTIVAHEWGHYLHHRLQQCGTAMCGALSEGWADFVALHTLIRSGESGNATYGMGTYAALDMVTDLGGDAAYFGIRRAPYTRNKNKNAMSFRHISEGEPLPNNHPRFELPSGNSEIHNAGEIWALMLFEAYQALLDRSRAGDYTFDEARRRMSDYVVAGLALAPADSTYLEARDAILATAAAADPEDAHAMAEGFARRGAGSCALSPPADSVDFIGVTEDADLAPRVAIGGVVVDDAVASCDEDGWLDGGERGRVAVVVGNPGDAPLEGAQLTVASSSPGLTFPEGTTALVPTIPPHQTSEVSVPVDLASRTEIGEVTVSVDLGAEASCEGTAAAEISTQVHIDEQSAVSRVDDVEAAATTWTPTGAGAEEIWTRPVDEGANHVWQGQAPGAAADTQLVSPPVTAGASGPLLLSFRHRHDFEFSEGIAWDGAVIEISDDGGATWRDLAELGTVPYGGVITNESGNPLADRNAFVGQSAGYPAMQPVAIDLGSSLAGKTVQIRFRIGTDAAIGAAGWEIDDIELGNIEETPFGQVNAEEEDCEAPIGPDAGSGDGDGGDDADGGCGCRAGHRAGATPWLVALAALIALRRRRRRITGPG